MNAKPKNARTKIVATIGPASSDRDTLTRMIRAGVDVVRLNFSHGKPQDHIDRATLVREVADECGKKVAIMADLQGPKIRVGKFENGKIMLANGDKFILDSDCQMGNQERVGLDYKALPRDLKGNDILLKQCLERGELVSVRSDVLDRGEGGRHSMLQACVPLIDTEERILAVLAIQQMPFFMFHERSFSLLAILAGHIADLLMSDAQALQLPDADAQQYSQLLKRSLSDARDHGLPASLFAFELAEDNGEEVQRLLESSQRGLDVQLKVINGRGSRLVLVLLPLTSGEGSKGYLVRLKQLFAERFGQGRELESLGVQTHRFLFEGGDERDALRHFLFNECALNDQQVAV